MDKERFIQALKNKSISEMQKIPKSDLHSHAGRGGKISYIENMLNVKITPLTKPLNSMSEMDEWYQQNILCHFPENSGYIQRVAAAFAQAKEDNILVQALSYSVRDAYWFGNLDIFIAVMNGIHRAFAQIGRASCRERV